MICTVYPLRPLFDIPVVQDQPSIFSRPISNPISRILELTSAQLTSVLGTPGILKFDQSQISNLLEARTENLDLGISLIVLDLLQIQCEVPKASRVSP